MRSTVIVTTYRRPDALKLVLKALLMQTVLADQVIVAEDGAWATNAELVAGLKSHWPTQLDHVTQEDRGFRLNVSRNRAIAHSTGDYLMLIDGDMVPERHYVADHLQWARPGHFAQGRRVRLNEQATARALAHEHLHFSWLMPGMERRTQGIRSPTLARMLTQVGPETKHTRGANMAFWRQDLQRINGFDMRYQGWGYDDLDLATRLVHAGLSRTYIRHAAFAYHLYHPQSDNGVPEANRARFEAMLAARSVRCEYGLDAIANET